MGGRRALMCYAGLSLDGGTVQRFAAAAGVTGDEDEGRVMSNAGATLLDAPPGTPVKPHLLAALDEVWGVSAEAGFFTPARLQRLAATVKLGGRVVVQEPAAAEDSLRKALLFSGLQGCETTTAINDGAVALCATKPQYEAGTKQALRKKPAPKAAPKWTLTADDDEDEVIDDDALLTEDDLKKPVVDANDDCEIGKGGRKACKNCSCGRAEGTLTEEQLNNPESACGSCYLGDAFRCSSCPYRGMPAFKPGEKISLPDVNVVDL